MLTGIAAMCTKERFIRISFMVLNICFSGFGIALLTGACIVCYDQRMADSYLSYSSFQRALESANVSVHTPDSLNIGETIDVVCIVFIVIGVLFLLLGIMGIIGAYFTKKALLIAYAVLLLVLILLELVCVVLVTVLREKFEGWIKDLLKDSIRKNYRGISGNDFDTLRWNFIMHSFQCCGVDRYTDFLTLPAEKWNVKIESDYIVRGKRIPFGCCKVKNDTNCVLNPNNTTSFMERGCYEVFRNWATNKADVVVGVGVIILVTEIVLLVLAFMICCTLQKNANYKDEELDPFEQFRLSQANLVSRNQDRVNPWDFCKDHVYEWPTIHNDSFEMYPPRQWGGPDDHYNEQKNAYNNGVHAHDSYTISRRQTESSLREPPWMSFARRLTGENPFAKPMERELRTEYPEQASLYSNSSYVRSPPSEYC